MRRRPTATQLFICRAVRMKRLRKVWAEFMELPAVCQWFVAGYLVCMVFLLLIPIHW